MGELYDERRQEPRFATDGSFQLSRGSQGAPGHIFDLSLNGAMLEHCEGQPLEPGTRTAIILHFPGQPPFVADVLVQHIADGRVGIEFYDMSTEHFATLATLIEQHLRSRQ
jgi:hypothetical protein